VGDLPFKSVNHLPDAQGRFIQKQVGREGGREGGGKEGGVESKRKSVPYIAGGVEQKEEEETNRFPKKIRTNALPRLPPSLPPSLPPLAPPPPRPVSLFDRLFARYY
jgi:hypothetical protein